ncbi:hypothetical protein NM688_g4605 [Phlebia brevispora]|uniref:Uncharacterized protein n=1 Tax=Phlebia brevispora TaxID=194682 RepID=A0ACC1T260_9APHY|nr:hypothetical protein NM688_g4605 [Phlebia brevispora]
MFETSTGVIPSLTADQPAYLMAAVSRTDYLSGNMTYRELVLNNMNTFFASNPLVSLVRLYFFALRPHKEVLIPTDLLPQDHNSQIVMWGLAAASAYRAYNDSTSLTQAVQAWKQVIPYQIVPHEVAINVGADSFNATIPTSCNGSPVTGGVFGYPYGSQALDAQLRPMAVDGETAAAFVALSAHLYEFTGESFYLNAAVSGAEFLQNHMQTAEGISLDTFNISGCQPLNLRPYTYITGFNIWGLSVVATHNASWIPFLNTLISTSVPYIGWTDELSGIITEGSSNSTDNFAQPSDVLNDSTTSCLKVVWIRGLHEAWTRIDPESEAAKFINAYLNVQAREFTFNALRDLAFNATINSYSPQWDGPAIDVVLPWGQLDALDVMNAAFSMVPTSLSTSSMTSASSDTSTFPTSPSPEASKSSSKTSKVHTPIIVGAVFGALVGLVLITLLCAMILRRRQARRLHQIGYMNGVVEAEGSHAEAETAYNIHPFMLPARTDTANVHGLRRKSRHAEKRGLEYARGPAVDPLDCTASNLTASSANTARREPRDGMAVTTSPPESRIDQSPELEPHASTTGAGGIEASPLPRLLANLMNLLTAVEQNQAQDHEEPPPDYDL